MNEAGANVRLIRQQVGMSLRAAADAADIDPATLSRIENGKTQLTADLASKIAKVLHVSVGMLFAPPGLVETAMLRMRKAPVLTDEQLLNWSGPEHFEEADDQVYLHVAMNVGSRHVFATIARDESNAPEVLPGDQLIFDARRAPRFGELVLAQNREGTVFVGRYRPTAGVEQDGSFQIVPVNRMYSEIESRGLALVLRGTRVEQRRTF